MRRDQKNSDHRASGIPEEAVHETSNEAHEAFKKELEARPDWRIPIFKYIKDGELPAERWEAQKIKAWSSRYCIMEERLYKRSLDEPYLLGVSPKDAFIILKQTHGERRVRKPLRGTIPSNQDKETRLLLANNRR